MKTGSVILLAGALLGCSSSTAQNSENARLSKIESRLSKLEADTFEISLKNNVVAYMRPADTGYSLIDTDFGRLAFSLQNVQPYANGSQISVQIGNPTTARFDGIKGKVEWGSADKDGLPIDDHVYSLDWTPTDALPAGRWHTFMINLRDVPPTKLGWVRISDFYTGSASLVSN